MRILANENIPEPVIKVLRHGHTMSFGRVG